MHILRTKRQAKRVYEREGVGNKGNSKATEARNIIVGKPACYPGSLITLISIARHHPRRVTFKGLF